MEGSSTARRILELLKELRKRFLSQSAIPYYANTEGCKIVLQKKGHFSNNLKPKRYDN